MDFIVLRNWVGVLPGAATSDIPKALVTLGEGKVLDDSQYDVPGLQASGLRAVAFDTSLRDLIASGDGRPGDVLAAEVQLLNESGGGGGAQTLAQTLALGRFTGGNDLVVSTGDAIIAEADLGGPGVQSGALELRTGPGSVSVGPVELLPGSSTGAAQGGGVLAVMGSSTGTGRSGTFEITPGLAAGNSTGGDTLLNASTGDGTGAGGIARLKGGIGGVTDAPGGLAELIGGDGGGANGDSGGIVISVGTKAAGGADGTIQLIVGSDTYTWPTADGTSGQQIVTDGNGVLSFATAAAGAGAAAITFGGGAVGSGGVADRFLNPWYDSDAVGLVEIFIEDWPFSGSIDQLRATWGAASGSVNVAFVLRINGADTALTFTALSDAGTGADLSNVVAIVAGDQVSFVVRKSAATGSSLVGLQVSMRAVAS